MLDASLVGRQGKMDVSADGRAGPVELLLRAVWQSAPAAPILKMLTACVERQLDPGDWELDAGLHHEEGRQQRWLADVWQDRIALGRAHIFLETRLPPISDESLDRGEQTGPARVDDGFGSYVALARVGDACGQLHSSAASSSPAWITIRYFNDTIHCRISGPLTLSRPQDCRIGVLQHREIDVVLQDVKVAMVMAVYEEAHG